MHVLLSNSISSATIPVSGVQTAMPSSIIRILTHDAVATTDERKPYSWWGERRQEHPQLWRHLLNGLRLGRRARADRGLVLLPLRSRA